MEIELPDGTILDAPDDADPSAVAKAYIRRQGIAQSRAASAKTDPSLYDQADARSKAALNLGRQGARAVGLAGRTILNTFAGAPLMAMDAGVAARNLIDKQGHELPSAMWERSLNDAGVPQFQGPIEKGGDIAGQMLLGSKLPAPSAANPAPAAFDPKAMRTVALEKAREAGYVVPPSTTNPSLLNKFLESWGGKIGTQQDAAARNQPVTDALVKGDLGIKPSADVGEGTLSVIRQQAAQNGYAPVRGVGTMRLDTKYGKALDEIAAPFAKSEAAFPGLNKTDILKTVESLKQGKVDTDTAIDTISILREKADAAFRTGEGKTGGAYKSMAKALEDAVERSLGRRGEDAQKMLSDYRAARQLIAKTHSAEEALNPALGNFDARQLARQLDNGAPLTGGMKKAAEASQAFKQATRLLTDSGSVRNTDVALGAGTAALSGSPWPLIYPFTRTAARDFMLSPTGQNLLTKPKGQYGLPPELVMALQSGLLGSQ